MKKLIVILIVMMITGCSSYVSRDEMKKALQQRDEVLVKVVAALKELQEKNRDS